MFSRVAPQAIQTLGLVIALGVVPGTGFPQSDAERVRADEKERIAEEILAAQAKDGPRSPSLIQLLTDLGVLYETEGEHMLATAVLEQARQLVRANYGLHSLDQVPLMQQGMANQQAIGNLVAARAIEEELLDLAERHPDDLRTAAIHREAGKRRLAVLRSFLAGEAPSEVYPETGLYSFWRDDMISGLVSDVQIHYADAAAVMLRNGLYSSDELRDLEMEILRSSDLVRRQKSRLTTRSQPTTIAAAPMTMQQNTFSSVSGNRIYRNPDRIVYNPALEDRMNTLSHLAGLGALQDAPAVLRDATEPPRGDGRTSHYELGRNSYSRLIAYDEAVFGSSAEEPRLRSRLEAYLQLADWDLLYSQNGVAFNQYLRVHELLKTTRSGETLIAELFAPPIPIVLPTLHPNPLQTTTSSRYIDLSFEVTKYGESRRVQIAGATPDVSNAEKDDLVSVIKVARFRPRVSDGELGRASPVVVRYYLD